MVSVAVVVVALLFVTVATVGGGVLFNVIA